MNDYQRVQKAKERLKRNKIPCFKYNYALDESVQNFSNYPATIQLSENEK